jgi:hypothetical protein
MVLSAKNQTWRTHGDASKNFKGGVAKRMELGALQCWEDDG